MFENICITEYLGIYSLKRAPSDYAYRQKIKSMRILSQYISSANPRSAAYAPFAPQTASNSFVKSFTNSTTVESIAESVRISSGYLRSEFNKHIGTSHYAYLSALRLEHAKMLLSSGYYRIYTVAEMCSYDNTKNFSTAYKRYFGIKHIKIAVHNITRRTPFYSHAALCDIYGIFTVIYHRNLSVFNNEYVFAFNNGNFCV